MIARLRAPRALHFALFGCLLVFLGVGPTFAAELAIEERAEGVALRLAGEEPFRVTSAAVEQARLLELAEGRTRVVTWVERDEKGRVQPFYALGLEDAAIGKARSTSYELALNHGAFDPLEKAPRVRATLAAKQGARLHLVQFVTQPLEDYREQLEQLGARVRGFIPHHAHIVEMDPTKAASIAELDFVRWVGPYHPAYRLEAALRLDPRELEREFPRTRYNILLFEHAIEHKQYIARRIEQIGGLVDKANAGKHLMVATLTATQLLELVSWDQVAFVDRWSPLEPDMDLVRQQGGAAELQTVAGYTGVGVRVESFDAGFDLDHQDFASRPLIEHGAVSLDRHGTACIGIMVGDGSGDPDALGLMPDAQGIVADYSTVGMTGPSRYDHTGELLQPPYEAVLQTASVGSARTTEYTTISAEHDTMLFDWDVLHCQSQSNAGNQNSRPQAWAKNVVSGGAFNHYNTADTSDDCWCNTASIGPAADGRIKPDLSFYYDDTYTTYTTSGGYGSFGGTSGATPSICGHFGIFFEMWAEGIFGNPVDPSASVFDNRPHMTTAKAVMINTARQYPFSGTEADMTRVHQGWGVPNVKDLYDLREKISVIDESVLLGNTERAEFNVYVEEGETALKVTMTYADPAGNPAAAIHRVNDLTLRVVSPSGTEYWGNVGLLEGNWSIPGGAPNTIDTVENVFVENPEAGLWTAEVRADELVEDGHVETPQLDADFALVTSGGTISKCDSAATVQLDRAVYACEDEAIVTVVDCDLNLDETIEDTTSVTLDSDSEPAGESLTLTETNPTSAKFRSSMALSTTDAAGVLWVAEGDGVTVTYIDEDDGAGGINIPRTDTALVDCSPPLISNVQATEVDARSARITFDTDEDARGAVRYGLSCANLDQLREGTRFTTSNAITLTGLVDSTTYFYLVEATDAVGNKAVDDNAGACYSFTTPAVGNYFTELFGSDNDLAFTRFTFTPEGGPDHYSSCSEAASAFSTDPSGATEIPLTDDDSELVTLGGGASVPFYGVEYSEFWVGSNGYVTFNGSDTAYTESFSSHFDLARVSVLFDDFNPNSAGRVSWQQESDRVAVTWEAVPEYNTSNASSFQLELFYDGVVTITILDTPVSDGLVGLSRGNNVPEDFFENDLSATPTCGASAGSVPGEAGAAPMLMVDGYDKATGLLSLSWGVPCEATGHVIEYGELSLAAMSSYNWSAQECGLGASGSYDWDTSTAAHESFFFIVVANNGSEEGSYGRSSAGAERPEDASSTSCPFPQNLAETCDAAPSRP